MSDIKKAMEKNFNNHINFAERSWKFDKKQKDILTTLLDDRTKMVFLSGPAGTSKTYLAVYAMLKLLKSDSELDGIYVRTVAESGSRSMGALPGSADEKFSPYMQPLLDKIDELLPAGQSKLLVEPVLDSEPRIKAIPVNYLRGASWKNKIVILDESQNFDGKELMTAISRIGENTTVIVCGDPEQSDINGRSAFKLFADLFNDEESAKNGIHSFEFDENDIKRSEILKFIVKKVKTLRGK